MPLIHGNCTVQYNCISDRIFGKLNCFCIYYEKGCENRCERPKECLSFIHGCILKEWFYAVK